MTRVDTYIREEPPVGNAICRPGRVWSGSCLGHIYSYESSVLPSDLQIVLEPAQINAAKQVVHASLISSIVISGQKAIDRFYCHLLMHSSLLGPHIYIFGLEVREGTASFTLF
jgi:UDP-glucose 6-dehydrogenase